MYLVHSFIAGYLEKNHKQSFKIEPARLCLKCRREMLSASLSQYKIIQIIIREKEGWVNTKVLPFLLLFFGVQTYKR